MAAKGNRRFTFPEIGAPENELLDYRTRYFNFNSVWRNRQMERMAICNYYQMNRQWIELDSELIPDGSRGYVLRDMFQKDSFRMPRPVLNYVGEAVGVEQAALGKRQLVPNVLATSTDPRVEAAAREAKKILEDRLKKNDWPSIRELVTFQSIVCGTGILRSYWDQSHADTVPAPFDDNRICPACATPVANASKVPEKAVQGSGFNLGEPQGVDLINTERTFDMTACPRCQSPMVPLDKPVADGDLDQFQRPLTYPKPKGRPVIEAVSPFELFPENSGVDVSPETCRVWGQATPRSLDWLEDRFPEACYDIMPDDPTELMRLHPMLGEWSVLGYYSNSMDSNIYEDHVMVYELHADKSYRFPLGHSTIIAGDKVLFDGPLYEARDHPDGTQALVPRVKYAAARWKLRQKDFWGQSLVEDLLSPQNCINGLMSQIVEARQRMASPNLLASQAMGLTGPEWMEDYGAGKIMFYQTDPLAPNAKPEVFGGITMPIEVYKEFEVLVGAIKEFAGPPDVEIGEAPRNVTTTSGLQLLTEQSDKRRAPRERSLVEAFQVIWKHVLELEWTLRETPDTYEMQSPEGGFERKEFDSLTIAGQTNVVIEKQAFIDRSLIQKEAAREAQLDQLYDVTSQAARKRLLELRGLPTDVNEDLNRQVDLAKRQYVDFVDQGRVPLIDPSIDDFRIHFQVLATMLMSDEGVQLQEQAGFPAVNKLIRGWEQQLTQMEMMEAQALAFYGGRVPPEQGEQMYAQGMVMYEQQVQAHEKEQQAGAVVAEESGVAPMGSPVPQPPPPPIFLPPAKEDRIYMLWMQMIGQSGQQVIQPTPAITDEPVMEDPMQAAMEQATTLDNFLKFRAVMEAYKLLAEEKEMKAMMGIPGAGMPSPGTPGGSPGVGGALPGMGVPGGPAPGSQPPAPPEPPGSGTKPR